MFPSNKNNEESKSVFDYVGGGLKKSVDVVKDKWPTPNSKISQKVKGPKELKDHVEDEIRDQAGDFFQDQFKKQIQSKVGGMKEELQEKTSSNADQVHSKAEEAKEKVQDRLLGFKDKLNSVKESGEQMQRSLQNNRSQSGRVKGVQDIKGVSHIKSSSSIKGSKDIKGLSNIKTYHS